MTLLLLCGCAAKQAQAPPDPPGTPQTQLSAPQQPQQTPETPQPTRRLEVDYNARAHADEAAETPEAAPAEDTPTEETDAAEEAAEKNDAPAAGRVIVIDPGHQAKGNFETEALGPGSTETKIKVSSGTASCNTGEPESKLVLAISLKLRTELEARGYTVLMTRTTEDVDLSNIDRAAIANDANADALLRIHANGSESAAAEGALTICQTAASPYNADLYAQSYALSSAVLDELCAAAGCRKLYVWETDTMSGINWSRVPVTIVEVGFMTNPAEDALLATEAYQDKLAAGIANGVDRYFREQAAQ